MIASRMLFPIAAAIFAASAQTQASSKAASDDITPRCELLLDLSYPAEFSIDALLLRAAQAIESDPACPLNKDIVDRILVLTRRSDCNPSIWSRLQALESLAGLHGLARHSLRGALASRLSIQRKTSERDAMSAYREYVRAGIAIGPFGDVNGDGFGLAHAPEFGTLEIDAPARSRYGDTIKWRSIRSRKSSAQLDLRDRKLSSRSAGSYYAILQLESDETGPAWLQLTTSGSFEAWWNGAELARVHRVVETRPTRLFYPVLLRKGWNRLLFKCAQSNISSFACRPVDENGNALLKSEDAVSGKSGLLRPELALKLHPIAAEPAIDVDAPGEFVEGAQWLAQRGRSRSATVLAALGNLRARRGATDQGLAMALRALRTNPSDIRLRVAAMACWRLARHIPGDLRGAETRKLLASCSKETIEAHAWLFDQKLEELRRDDKKEDALRRVDARLAKNPKEVPSLQKRVTLLRSLGWNGAARSALEELAAQSAQPHVHRRLLAEQVARDGDDAAALDMVLEILSQRPGDSSLLSKAIELAKNVERPELVDRLMQTRWEDDPQARGARMSRAEVLADRKDFAAALEELRAIEKENPKDTSALERIAEIEFRLANDDKAVAAAEKSLELDPQQHELRHWIARLKKTQRFAELQPWQLDAQEAIAAFEANADDSSSATTLVLDQMILRVYPDGSQMEETHVLKRINTVQGVEANETSDAAAEADELLTLRTITPDGKSWSPHRVAGNFTLPRLAKGVFVEEQYRNYKSAPGLTPIDFVTFFFRGLGRPYRYTRLVVLMPKAEARRFRGDYVLRNFPRDGFRTQTIGELQAFVFLRENMRPIAPEKSMPPVAELAPWVTFGRSQEIAPAVRAWKTQFALLTKPHLELQAKCAELCTDKTSDAEKARAIHDFCHAHTPDVSQRGGSPAPVSILLKGEGPRFWLELALLRCAGIRWTPAVLRPYAAAFDPDPKPAFTGAGRWPARGALVRPRGAAPYWLLLGAPRWQPFGTMPSHFDESPTAGCPYLLLEGDTGRTGTLDGAPIEALTEARMRVKVELRNRDAVITADVAMPGKPGMLLKEQLRNRPKTEARILAQRLSAYLFRGSVTFRRVEWLGLNDRAPELRMRLHLIRRGALRARDNRLLLPPIAPPRSYTRIFGGRDQRLYPFVIGALLIDDWEVRIDPGDARFAEMPRGRLEQHELFDWSLSYEMDGAELVMRRRSTLRPGRVQPQDYRKFLRLCRIIDSLESRPLVLRKK